MTDDKKELRGFDAVAAIPKSAEYKQAVRNQGLENIRETLEEIYGPRCSDFEAGCTNCVAWAVFDLIVKLTDSSMLEDDPK